MPNRMKHQKDHTLESIGGLKFETCLFRCGNFSLQFEHQDDVIEGGEEIKRQAVFLNVSSSQTAWRDSGCKTGCLGSWMTQLRKFLNAR